MNYIQMTQQPFFGWLWRARFDQLQKQSTTYHTAAAANHDRSAEVKEALDIALKEHTLVNNIASAITDNELSSNSLNTYTADDLRSIIKQKYFPPASADQVNSVLEHLGQDVNKVAIEARHISPNHDVTLYQSRASYDHMHGLDDKRFLYRSRL